MELIERSGFLTALSTIFENVEQDEGHSVFISGESGIGKTALVKNFCKELKGKCNIYNGTCDALFTPRPLAPLYDILLQIRNEIPGNSNEIADRTAFFTHFIHELKNKKETSLIVFEDIHWADEATLDFIKFLARRISQLRCLFILTYRDNEIHPGHPLQNVLGHMDPDSYTKIQLPHLSKNAVEKMAAEKGYNGENVYSITGGNPFYVNEILASYSMGVPENIKDSIISAYNRQEERTRQVWELLSVIPTSFEIRYLEKFEPQYAAAIERCLQAKILFQQDWSISFKHELFRRAIEGSLSPLRRVALNKRILELFGESFEQDHQIERIIHHAKNANDYDTVVKYAPLGAMQAASVGAHVEASKLYLTAIEYYQGNDEDVLLHFYESYAYECYLTNRINDAIIYTSKSLELWKRRGDTEKIGNSLRFLSRLWWFETNSKQAEIFGVQAIETLENQPSSSAKAMAYSNMSQLKMLTNDVDQCISWGEKAISIAKELGDDATLSHAFNNIGTVKMKIPSMETEGLELMGKSLAIALKNSYHEHVARAYTNLGGNGLMMKNYAMAKKNLDEGIRYSEERDLDSWTAYMISMRARLHLETGHWKEAASDAENLLKNENQTMVVKIGALLVTGIIKIRRGDHDALPLLLEAKTKAFTSRELQRIIPALNALLEYEWITGNVYIDSADIEQVIDMIERQNSSLENKGFAFWLWKARKQHMQLTETYENIVSSLRMALKNAARWEKTGCPYEQALSLFDGSEDDKRKAITLMQGLGATAVYEKMKSEMRTSGIKSIPRGIRKTTQSNPALLTDRELDVLQLLQEGLQNKEIASRLFISAKTVDHHISAILYKLEVNSRIKAVQEATRMGILK